MLQGELHKPLHQFPETSQGPKLCWQHTQGSSRHSIQALEWLCDHHHPSSAHRAPPSHCLTAEDPELSAWGWSVPLSWCVDKIPARQINGLPIFLGFLGHLDATTGLIFQLDECNDFGNGCGCSQSFFYQFPLPCPVTFRVLAFSFRTMCFYVSRSLSSNLHEYVPLCLLLILEQFTYSKCLLNGLVTK